MPPDFSYPRPTPLLRVAFVSEFNPSCSLHNSLVPLHEIPLTMARELLFAALATTLLFTVPSTAQNNSLGCFYYDGTPAPKLTPCVDTSGGGQSTCCSQGSICWSNGICQVNYNDFAEDYLRDGCTDKTWKSPDCPPRQCTSKSI